jgi:hypothetical protein
MKDKGKAHRTKPAGVDFNPENRAFCRQEY